jgi:hypothetical protein
MGRRHSPLVGCAYTNILVRLRHPTFPSLTYAPPSAHVEMDPLSLAASIAGLAGVVGTVIATSYKFASEVKGASVAQKHFLRELKALRQPLQQLEDMVDGIDESSPRYPKASSDLASTLNECQTDVEDLHGKLQKRLSAGKVKGTILRLTWPLAEEETLKAVERLGRYRELFQGALALDTW